MRIHAFIIQSDGSWLSLKPSVSRLPILSSEVVLMSTFVKNRLSIPDCLVLVTEYIGHSMAVEMTGTHEIHTLYAGNDPIVASCAYAGYTTKKGESCVYMKLLSVEMAKHWEDKPDEEEEEDFDR